MIFSVIAIVLSIISFFHPWFFIGSCIAIVLAVAEYILELTHADIFGSAAIGISAIALGVIALTLTIISLIVALGKVNGNGGTHLMLALSANLISLIC